MREGQPVNQVDRKITGRELMTGLGDLQRQFVLLVEKALLHFKQLDVERQDTFNE